MTPGTRDRDARRHLARQARFPGAGSAARQRSRTGQALGARSDAYPGREFDGIVSDASTRASIPVTRSVTVRARDPESRPRAAPRHADGGAAVRGPSARRWWCPRSPWSRSAREPSCTASRPTAASSAPRSSSAAAPRGRGRGDRGPRRPATAIVVEGTVKLRDGARSRRARRRARRRRRPADAGLTGDEPFRSLDPAPGLRRGDEPAAGRARRHVVHRA